VEPLNRVIFLFIFIKYKNWHRIWLCWLCQIVKIITDASSIWGIQSLYKLKSLYRTLAILIILSEIYPPAFRENQENVNAQAIKSTPPIYFVHIFCGVTYLTTSDKL
jgi:hypothetical protein